MGGREITPASTYRMDYVWRDGALVTTTTGYRKDKDTARTSSTLKTYDGNGHIRSVIDPSDTRSDITRQFNTDANGTVLRSVQVGQEVPSYLHVDADGKPLPPVRSNAGDLTANEQFQLVAAGQVLGRYGEMVNPDAPRDKGNNLQFIADQDFNFVFKSVNDGAAQGTSTYTVAKGDTLQSIAKAQLGDAELWFTIAQANGLADSAGLEEGQVLRIPAVVVTSTNNADGTFEAYDPTQIVGDTTPIIPQPPKKKQNVLKMIIIVVAMVVITIYTAGALSGATGGFLSTMQAGISAIGAGVGGAAGGGIALGVTGTASGTLGLAGFAVAGAAGSIGGQLVGMALGEQDKFSWRQVGLAALGGAVSAGLPTFVAGGGANAIANAVIKGAVSSTITQGIGYATGLQDSFSWRAVAASAVGAGVGQAVGPVFGDAFGNTAAGQFGARLATGLVAGTAAAAMRGGKFTIQQVAVDAFGQALGNSIAGQIGQASQQEQRAGFSQAGASAMDAEYGIGVQNDAWAHQAQQQAHLDRAGFIDAGRDMMGPEAGVWGQQSAFANEALTQRSEDMRDAAMGRLMGSSPSPADNRSLLNAVERGINPGAYTSVAGNTVRAPSNGLGISSLIGTSNPQAVGNFMRANGMTSDNLQGGRNYFIPDSTTAYGNSTALGQYGLNLGNARAAEIRQNEARIAAGVANSGPPVGPDGLRIGPTVERGQLLAGAPSGVSLIPGAAPGQVAPPVQRSASVGDFFKGWSVAAGRTSVLDVPDAVYESEGYKSGYSLNQTIRRPLELLAATGFISTDGSFAAGGVGGLAKLGRGVGPVQQGSAGVERAIADLEASGGRVLGREITIDAAGVRTRPDLFVELPNGSRAFLEIKTGSFARWTPNQTTAFPEIWTQGGIPRGSNAAAAGLTPGVAIGPTPVWTIRYQWPLLP